MKKRVISLLGLFIMACSLTSCQELDAYLAGLINPTNSQTENTAPVEQATTNFIVDDSTTTTSIIMDEKYEAWLNMFKFENITVKGQRYFFGNNVYYIKYYDGKIYVKDNGADSFEQREELIGYGYDTMVNYYNKFTLDEANHQYTATDLVRTGEYEDHNPCDVVITVYDGVITHMEITEKLSESLQITTNYTFYNRDCTSEDSLY